MDTATASPSRLRHFLLVVLPLGVILGVVGVGYIFYTQQREQYFTQRYVRALATVAQQTEAAIDSLDSAFDRAMRASKGAATRAGKKEPERFRFVKKRLEKQLELTPLKLSGELPPGLPTGPAGAVPAVPSVLIQPAMNGLTPIHGGRALARDARDPPPEAADATLYFCRSSKEGGDEGSETDPSEFEQSGRDDEDTLFGMTGALASRPEDNANVRGQPAVPAQQSSTSGSDWLCAKRDLSMLLRPFLRDSPIEHLDLFVIGENGRVLFQTTNSGLRFAALSSKADQPAPPKDAAPAARGLPTFEEVTSATVARPIDVNGPVFFSQPLRLKAGSGQPGTWALGALVPLDSMPGEGHRVPLAVVAGVPLLCLLALLALPVLKLLTVGGRDPLSASTVGGLTLAVLVLTALATLVTLDWYAHGLGREQRDYELRMFAQLLEDGFRAELGAARSALTDFRKKRLQERQERPEKKPFGKMGQDYITCDRILDEKAHPCRSRTVDRPPPKPTEFQPIFEKYPSFDMLYLIGLDRGQREKWTTADTTTPESEEAGEKLTIESFPLTAQGHVDADLSGYFDSIPHAELMKRFALDAKVSPNTGRIVTRLSVPIFSKDGTGSLDGAIRMLPHLRSIVDLVVPPDVGFAVIEPTGRVVFHSISSRRLSENFFAEAPGELALQSAVFASRAGFFDISYHGQPQRAFVQPLPDTQWSLLVFRDTDTLQAANLEAVVVALLGFFALVVICALWLALLRWVVGPVLPACLWPTPSSAPRYTLLVLASLVLAAWFGWSIDADDGAGTLLVTVLSPLTALTLVVVGLTLGQTSTRRWLAAVGALTVLGVIGAAVGAAAHGCAGVLPWLAIAVLLLAIIASWEPSWLASSIRSNGRFAPRYVALVGTLLISLAVLPTVAFFQDAFAVSMESLGRARQIKLAEQVAQRAKDLSESFKDLKGKDQLLRFWESKEWDDSGVAAFARAAQNGSSPNDDRSAPMVAPVNAALARSIRTVFPDFCRESEPLRESPCKVRPASRPEHPDLTAERCGIIARHFTAAVVTALPVYDRDVLEFRHAVYGRASDCSWGTSAGQPFSRSDGRDRYAPGVLVKRGTWFPVPDWHTKLDWPPLTPAVLVFMVVLGGALAVLWVTLGWVIRRVFSLDVWEILPPSATDITPAVGAYYLRPPAAAVERLAARTRAAGGAVIDLATLAGPAELADRIARCSSGPVLLTHLERDMDDGAWNQQKLAALEDLLRRSPPLHVDVVSETDLIGHFARTRQSPIGAGDVKTPVAADEVARWARVLSRLDKRRADLPEAPLPPCAGELETLRDECEWTPHLRAIGESIRADPRWTALSGEALVRHVGDLANAHYHTVWRSLAEEERLLLYQLAADGFINPKQRELGRDLMRRGLIRRAPALRVMNESFSKFVRQVEDRATIRRWQRAEGASTWDWLRNGVLVVAVVGAVFLFMTQPESYTKWLALLTALTTVGGGMTQLLGLFDGARRPKPAQ